MIETGSFQQHLSTQIYLFNALDQEGLLANEEIRLELAQDPTWRDATSLEKAKQAALNFIAALLAIDSEDHVVITEENNQIVIAKTGRIGEPDMVRADSVLATLRAIRQRCTWKRAFCVITAHEYGHSLLQRQVKELEQVMFQRGLVSRVIGGAKELYEPPKHVQLIDLLDRLASSVSALSTAKEMDAKCWWELSAVAENFLDIDYPSSCPRSNSALFALESLRTYVSSFFWWRDALLCLIKFLRTRDAAYLGYRFIPTANVSGRVPLECGLLTAYNQAASTLRRSFAESYDKVLAELTEIYNLEDGPVLLSVRVHPEVRILLDRESREASISRCRVIGSTVEPCVFCAMWVRLYNEHFDTAWMCRGAYDQNFDVRTDWAAPGHDLTQGLDPGTLDEVHGALLAEIQNKISIFVRYEFEEREYLLSSSEIEDEGECDRDDDRDGSEDDLYSLDDLYPLNT